MKTAEANEKAENIIKESIGDLKYSLIGTLFINQIKRAMGLYSSEKDKEIERLKDLLQEALVNHFETVAILSKSSSPEIPDSSWIDFDKSKGSKQKLPPVKKYVACQMKSLNNSFPDPIVIGYLKYAAGGMECPNFITPGAIVIPRDKTISDLRESLKASERFRAEDAASAIAEANSLRERVKDADALFNCIKQNQDVIPSWMKEAYENYAK